MKYLLGIIGLGIILLGAGEWQKTDWKKGGIVSDYNCHSCIDAYSYQGWRFTQTAKLGIYHPVVSIPQTGSGYCDHQCITEFDDSFGDTDYYDAIGAMQAYRNGDNMIALWAYRHATGGPILSHGYFYRCIEKNGKLYKEGKIHAIPGPDWLDTNQPEECGEETEKPGPLISPNASEGETASPVKTFRYSGWTQDHLASTLTLKIVQGGSIEGVYTIKGKSSPPGQPCWSSARIPYHGYLTGTSHPAAKGTLEASRIWCPGDPNDSGMDIPADTFELWYETGKGLVLDIGNQHYRVMYSNPLINPFQR